MPESLINVCSKCKGTEIIEVHKAGMIHYETDAGEPCPAYHYESVPCPQCEEVKRRIAEAVEVALKSECDWRLTALKIVRAEEREACARRADSMIGATHGEIAAAIRARGEL